MIRLPNIPGLSNQKNLGFSPWNCRPPCRPGRCHVTLLWTEPDMFFCVGTYVCILCIYIYMRTHTHTSIRMYIYIYISLCVCMYIYICTYIHMILYCCIDIEVYILEIYILEVNYSISRYRISM